MTREMSNKDKQDIFPEAHSTIQNIFEELNRDKNFGNTTYGHAAVMIVTGAYAACEELSAEEQRASLRLVALEYLERYGPKFLEFMKPELQEALGIKSEDESSENQ